jgi:hypothetical protein
MDTDPGDKNLRDAPAPATRRTLHVTRPAAGLPRKPLKTRGRRTTRAAARAGSRRETT